MKLFNNFLRRILFGILALGLLGLVGLGASFAILIPQLPSVEMLRDIQFQVPLQVFAEDGQLIAEYGTKKRIPLSYDQVPEPMIKAVLAAEDDRFFHHPGVDYQGLVRAAVVLATTGEKAQGGSTITMQVARNFFLSNEKTYLRKLNEILLSFKIEHELTKEQILELYLNKIYLGNRAYGVGAAAQIYYGKPLAELSIDQFAMIAGLPKAPSRYNPIADPQRALLRRDYVLKRMRQLRFISDKEYETAKAQPSGATLHASAIGADAPYIGEMVRADLYAQYGEDAYTKGLNVYTTLNSSLQSASDTALRKGLLDFERRHGYRGPVRKVQIDSRADAAQLPDLLASDPDIGGLKPALILSTQASTATALLADGSKIKLEADGLSWALRSGKTNPVASGDVVYVENVTPGKWSLAQIPAVSGATVSIDPDNGAIRALSGGFDFYQSKFNRVIQAKRQPGSSFKPFIYSAALEHGFTAASIINDAPVVFDDPSLESAWRPENFSGKFYGPTRMREALTHSRNLVSIRLLQAVGPDVALDHATRFGFDRSHLPRNLSLALGSGEVTPLELARGYTVFANGGFLVQPYYISRIEDMNGKLLFQAKPVVACRECEPVITPSADGTTPTETAPAPTTTASGQPLAKRTVSPQNIYIMTSMMRDVIRAGTATRAMQLGRNDLAGKTGTTNDQRDAWFAGFNKDLVTVSWVGFDDSHPLGNDETGGRSALPIWMDVMRVALEGKPQIDPPQPPGIISVRIDPETGMLARGNQANAIFEIFKVEDAPQRQSDLPDDSVSSGSRGRDGGTASQPLF
ncbi:MAG: penicillin-binding protein 1A [Gammaproteobacteria bacterium]|nr:penicillin-binding protein 1A [Gammaproteobacteria bacterium]